MLIQWMQLLTNFGFLDRFMIFCIFGMFTNGCEWTPSLTENHKTLPNWCFLDKKMDLNQGFKSNLVKLHWFSINFAYQKIDNFSYLSVWEEYWTEPHQTYMDVSTNFVKYLWNFGVNLCIMDLRKIRQSFKLSKMADPSAAQDWAEFSNFGPTLTWNISAVEWN